MFTPSWRTTTIIFLGMISLSFQAAADEPSRREILENYLSPIDTQISATQDALDAVRADPQNTVAIRMGSDIVAVNIPETLGSDEFAAAISAARVILEESPTATALVNGVLGRTVSNSLENYGFNARVAGFAGWVAGAAAEKAQQAAGTPSEETLQTLAASWFADTLRENALAPEDIEAEIALLWQVRDEIEAALQDQALDVSELCNGFVFSDLGADFETPDAVALVGVRIPLFAIGGDYYVFGNAHLNPDMARVSGRYSFEGDKWVRTDCAGGLRTAEHDMILRNDPPNPQAGVSFEGRSATRYDLERATIYVFSE